MRSDNWRDLKNLTKEQRAFPVFRFRRGAKMNQNRNVYPFTELPEELKRGRPTFGSLVRGFFNFLLLLVLGLALLGLVLAFAYQMINNPQALGEWAGSIITTVENLVQSLLAALPGR